MIGDDLLWRMAHLVFIITPTKTYFDSALGTELYEVTAIPVETVSKAYSDSAVGSESYALTLIKFYEDFAVGDDEFMVPVKGKNVSDTIVGSELSEITEKGKFYGDAVVGSELMEKTILTFIFRNYGDSVQGSEKFEKFKHVRDTYLKDIKLINLVDSEND